VKWDNGSNLMMIEESFADCFATTIPLALAFSPFLIIGYALST
jgi:hypothetical protein